MCGEGGFFCYFMRKDVVVINVCVVRKFLGVFIDVILVRVNGSVF